MHHPRLRLFALMVALVSLLGSGLVPALAQDASPAAGARHPFADLALPEIAVTITETAFEGVPAELAAGRYVLTVTNALAPAEGPVSSGVNFLRLSEELTAEAFAAFIARVAAPAAAPQAADGAAAPPVADESALAPPPWLYEVALPGGPYALPGETASAVIDLTAGEWVLWSESPGAPQPPVPVTVTGDAPADAPAVNADMQIKMAEYAFVVPSPLAAGPQVIEIANAGQEPHFFTMARVPEGTAADDALAAVIARYGGPAAAGGVRVEDLTIAFVHGTQAAGVTAWYAADLTPGAYVAFCFIPDPVNGVPHVMLGMTRIVEVA
ncbi:MAG: hypothetical protein R2853_21155 [Thermomicrobiales bacterium]